MKKLVEHMFLLNMMLMWLYLGGSFACTLATLIGYRPEQPLMIWALVGLIAHGVLVGLFWSLMDEDRKYTSQK